MNDTENRSPGSSFNTLNGSEIAVIGMSARFPGARNVNEYWQNLRDGIESISFFNDEELVSAGVPPALVSAPNYVKAAPILEEVDLFDASFFGYSPREAEIMDPQHRLFLQTAWEAIENAGYDPYRYRGRIGVYAGAGQPHYYLNNLLSYATVADAIDSYYAWTGNGPDYLCTRVSYKLNLRGPSVVVQTACSTSLVAIHIACQDLLTSACDIALAGGVSISHFNKCGYIYQNGHISSPDGHCRAFDSGAQGTIPGSGVGIVVLKRLSEAFSDGDSIQAVIKGSAINNDGSLKVGYMAPGIEGQANVIAEALSMAEVNPETVTYVEAHGTGTPLGDPIEVSALTKAFRGKTSKRGYCGLGSVKTNFGHLDAAAGVAGFIKVVLSLKHKLLPPSLHFRQPNPQIDFENSPFYVVSKLTEWRTSGAPLRAGVSSFGIGGTNAHVILEEAPPIPEECAPTRPWQLLVISAKTESALNNGAQSLANYLEANTSISMADVSYTLQVGRAAFGHRRMVVCRDASDAASALRSATKLEGNAVIPEQNSRPIVFMFPGQGSQHAKMGEDLYRNEATFREHFDLTAEWLAINAEIDPRELLFSSASGSEEVERRLRQTWITQPFLFAIEYALAQLWISWGVRPQAMIGHSIGEYVAATLAGVFTREDALQLVVTRARLMQQMPAGAMLAVGLSEEDVRYLLNDDISIAAVNSPSACVISGPIAMIDEISCKLEDRDISCRRLRTSHAFHSSMMDAVMSPFVRGVSRIKLAPPQTPYISNLTGTWIKPSDACDPEYWSRHLRQPVRFSDGIRELLKLPNAILLEVGPGKTLSALAKEQSLKNGKMDVLTSMSGSAEGRGEQALLLETLGKLWLGGVEPDWKAIHSSPRRRIPLSTSQFDLKRFWVDRKTESLSSPPSPPKRQNLDYWFYTPSWTRSSLALLASPAESPVPGCNWLVFVDDCGLGNCLADRLRQNGENVITVNNGGSFQTISDYAYTLNPREPEGYTSLLADVRKKKGSIQNIVHLWNVNRECIIQPQPDALDVGQDLSFFSLVFLARALSDQTHFVKLVIVSNGLSQVNGDEPLDPGKALLLGPSRVIPKELSNVACHVIDICLPSSNSNDKYSLVDQLITEIKYGQSGTLVAYRGKYRWTETLERVSLEPIKKPIPRLRQGGVVLIAGGLGGIGFAIAKHLVGTAQANLILTGRSKLPPEEQWQEWMENHDENDPVSQKLRQIKYLEEMGATVLARSADVANEEQMRAVVNDALERFGAINGVIHAAGVSGGGIIALKTRKEAIAVLDPKVKGTLVLDRVLNGIDLDFMVLCSSLASIIGPPGQVDYCAANAFLDAFAVFNAHCRGRFIVSINWDTWREIGMAVKTIVPANLELIRAQKLAVGVRTEEGLEVLERTLNANLPQVVVSTIDVTTATEQISAHEEDKYESPPPASHDRPHLKVPYTAPKNDFEGTIASIWQEVLGISHVGIDDNFFDLGGHSLMATQLVSRLRKAFLADIPLRILFEFPTIAELALRIQQSLESNGELDRLLKEVEALSNEEIEAIFSQGETAET